MILLYWVVQNSRRTSKKEPQDPALTKLERKYGDYVYQNHFPFGKRINAFSCSPDDFTSFSDLLRRIKTVWKIMHWTSEGRNISQFHSELYRIVTEEQKNAIGRFQLCVVFNDLYSQESAIQIDYFDFQRRNLYSGFKSLLVLRKPENKEIEHDVAFGNLLFVFVGEDLALFVPEISSLKIAEKNVPFEYKSDEQKM